MSPGRVQVMVPYWDRVFKPGFAGLKYDTEPVTRGGDSILSLGKGTVATTRPSEITLAGSGAQDRPLTEDYF